MRSRLVLGLDLGEFAFKAVQLEIREGRRPLLQQARIIEIPADADDAARRETLKQLLKGIPLGRFAQIVSIVDDPFVCVHPVTTPPIPASELQGAVRWELQRYLAVPVDEVSLDYQLTGETETDGVKKLKLLGVAIPRGSVQQHMALLADCGISPTQLIPKAVATASWFSGIGRAGDRPVGVLLFGGMNSEFLVVQSGEILFTRKIPVCGTDITKGMTGVLMTAKGQVGLSEKEAEKIKREIGIPAANSSEITPFGVSGLQILSLIRGSLDRLAVELERSITFYGESTGGAGVGELVVVGGSAHLKGLGGWLQSRLGIRITVPSMIDGVQVSPDQISGPAATEPLSFVPAVGAALSAGSGVNLLPVEIKEAGKQEVKRAAATGLITLILLGALVLRIGMGTYHGTLKKQIAAFQMEEKATAADLAKALAADAAQAEMGEQPYWSELFKDLSQSVPKEIHLLELHVNGRQIVMRGRVRETGRATDIILTDFIRTLSEGMFTQVKLVSSHQLEQQPQNAEFEISCQAK